MIQMELTIDTTQEEFKKCIVAAMQKRDGNNNNVSTSQVKDFEIEGEVIFSDVQNMLLGSCLGELALNKDGVLMIRSY